MMSAYSECYLQYVKKSLGSAFHIAVSREDMDIDEFASLFCKSKAARGMENRDPRYLAGMSGLDIVNCTLGTDLDIAGPVIPDDAYWTGYIFAKAQWKWNLGFSEIQEKYPCSLILSHYPTYHEMDDSRMLDVIGKRLIPDNIIKSRRRAAGMTQDELSKATGISLGTIRAYEQNVLSIDNAPVRNVVMLGRALGMDIMDIILGQGTVDNQ